MSDDDDDDDDDDDEVWYGSLDCFGTFLRTLLTRYHFHKLHKKCVYEHEVSFEGRFGDNVSGKMNAVIGKFVHRFTPLFFKFKTTLLLQLNIWFVNLKLN